MQLSSHMAQAIKNLNIKEYPFPLRGSEGARLRREGDPSAPPKGGRPLIACVNKLWRPAALLRREAGYNTENYEIKAKLQLTTFLNKIRMTPNNWMLYFIRTKYVSTYNLLGRNYICLLQIRSRQPSKVYSNPYI